ncbi:helix-turn-helix domain-containing protein [Alicyclobacillus pomorum]|uniref:helix-turn-helix domain-containing protein n=1 Tax=Alicyclobacillus pomorum TaxID=204470 RepID=UPI0003FD199D|nr:helix-turn-helix transcriptional regulator [Alicyclobacillus pomorum]
MIGERLRQLRKAKKMTQQDVADRLKLAKSTISQYENGVNEPDADTLAKLAELLDTTTDYLITGDTVSKGVDASISPEEREFLEWVKEHVTGQFFYDFHQSKDKEAYMRSLKLIYDLEKGRKPGQKQGE